MRRLPLSMQLYAIMLIIVLSVLSVLSLTQSPLAINSLYLYGAAVAVISTFSYFVFNVSSLPLLQAIELTSDIKNHKIEKDISSK